MALPNKCSKCGEWNTWTAEKPNDLNSPWVAYVTCKNPKCLHAESEILPILKAKYE